VPRGFGEVGLSGEANALKELREETGYIGEHAELLGSLNTDSGLTDSAVSYYHVPILQKGAAKPETEEAILKVSLQSRQDIWKAVRAGEIKDNFTVTALSLYEESLRAQTAGPGKR
jgi:ADP-ribose pyrophosphatase